MVNQKGPFGFLTGHAGELHLKVAIPLASKVFRMSFTVLLSLCALTTVFVEEVLSLPVKF